MKGEEKEGSPKVHFIELPTVCHSNAAQTSVGLLHTADLKIQL
jgi:hypothetical protein